MHVTKRLVPFVLLILSTGARSETLVLLQGYLGDPDYWRQSGVTRPLQEAGWGDAGNLYTAHNGIYTDRPLPAGNRRVYTVSLPSEAPLMVQLRYLEQYLDFIRTRHPYESLLFAGHSAGGVLGRLYMVEHPDVPVGLLVTFASPHLGTDRAEIGALAGSSPLGWVAPWLGAGTLNRSQGLYRDLARERPGSLLFWLNRQPHPESRYVSVVRTGEGLLDVGDLVVPEWSQDMNRVPALLGRGMRIETPGGHALGKRDGRVLVNILARGSEV